jgi:hypothetical protein
MKRLAPLIAKQFLGLLVLIPVMLLGPGALAADNRDESHPSPKTATVGTSVITPFFGAYLVEGKIRASKNFAASFIASYLSTEKDAWKSRAGTVGAGLDYFFQGDALRRWYVEAIGELWLVSPRHVPSGSVAPMGIGYAVLAVVGYQLVFDRGPMVDLGAGVVAFHLPGATVEAAGGSFSSQANTTVYPVAKISVGWAF